MNEERLASEQSPKKEFEVSKDHALAKRFRFGAMATLTILMAALAGCKGKSDEPPKDHKPKVINVEPKLDPDCDQLETASSPSNYSDRGILIPKKCQIKPDYHTCDHPENDLTKPPKECKTDKPVDRWWRMRHCSVGGRKGLKGLAMYIRGNVITVCTNKKLDLSYNKDYWSDGSWVTDIRGSGIQAVIPGLVSHPEQARDENGFYKFHIQEVPVRPQIHPHDVDQHLQIALGPFRFHRIEFICRHDFLEDHRRGDESGLSHKEWRKSNIGPSLEDRRAWYWHDWRFACPLRRDYKGVRKWGGGQ